MLLTCPVAGSWGWRCASLLCSSPSASYSPPVRCRPALLPPRPQHSSPQWYTPAFSLLSLCLSVEGSGVPLRPFKKNSPLSLSRSLWACSSSLGLTEGLSGWWQVQGTVPSVSVVVAAVCVGDWVGLSFIVSTLLFTRDAVTLQTSACWHPTPSVSRSR